MYTRSSPYLSMFISDFREQDKRRVQIAIIKAICPPTMCFAKWEAHLAIIDFYKKRSTKVIADRLWHPQQESNL